MREDESLENIDWRKDWISEVYIEAGSNAEDIKREYYTYEVTDLLGDVGGYLGLFLGWSLLDLTLNIFNTSFAFCKSFYYDKFQKIFLKK